MFELTQKTLANAEHIGGDIHAPAICVNLPTIWGSQFVGRPLKFVSFTRSGIEFAPVRNGVIYWDTSKRYHRQILPLSRKRRPGRFRPGPSGQARFLRSAIYSLQASPSRGTRRLLQISAPWTQLGSTSTTVGRGWMAHRAGMVPAARDAEPHAFSSCAASSADCVAC